MFRWTRKKVLKVHEKFVNFVLKFCGNPVPLCYTQKFSQTRLQQFLLPCLVPEVTEEGCPFVCFPQLPGSGGRGLCLLHARHRLLAVPVSPGRAGLQTDTLVCESFFLLSFMCWLCAGLFKKCFLISVLKMRLFLLCWSFSSSFFSLVFFFLINVLIMNLFVVHYGGCVVVLLSFFVVVVVFVQ